MTKRDMIIDVLNDHSCQTGFQIMGAIFRKYNEKVSPPSIAGSIRPMIEAGYMAKSPNSNGKMVYWLTDLGREKLIK